MRRKWTEGRIKGVVRRYEPRFGHSGLLRLRNWLNDRIIVLYFVSFLRPSVEQIAAYVGVSEQRVIQVLRERMREAV